MFLCRNECNLELSRAVLRELNVIASSLRSTESQSVVTPEEAMFQLEEHREGPVLLVEPSETWAQGHPATVHTFCGRSSNTACKAPA